MKKLLALPFALLLAAPAFAQSRTYDSRVPVVEEEYIEVEEIGPTEYRDRMDQERLEQQRMESMNRDSYGAEHRGHLSRDGVDYMDRTRTNRERHAINTSGDASDDR